jgi:carbonic anhydrase/acetyltransferase-like protein (isoleucine patch superfamily)
VEPGAGVAAAALVSEGSVVPTGQIAIGVPARPRPAPGLSEWVAEAVRHYLELAERFQAGLRRIG